MTDSTRPTDPTCDDVREMAGSFVLRALPDTQAAIRAHLESCPEPARAIAPGPGLSAGEALEPGPRALGRGGAIEQARRNGSRTDGLGSEVIHRTLLATTARGCVE